MTFVPNPRSRRASNSLKPRTTALHMRPEPPVDQGSSTLSNVVALEPAVAPEFARAFRGYDRDQVDTFVGDLRQRLAAMRTRARRAEAELRRVRAAQSASRFGSHPASAAMAALSDLERSASSDLDLTHFDHPARSDGSQRDEMASGD